MSDTTTPTAYVEELAQLGYRAEVDRMVNEQIPTWAMNRWEDLPIDAHDSYRVVSKASAEKVLCDLGEYMARYPFSNDSNAAEYGASVIAMFAAEHGLELPKGGEG